MKLKYVIASLALVSLFAGCKDAAEYVPSIYITEAQNAEAKTVTIDGAGGKASFSITSAQIVDRDTHVTLEVVPELIEGYNSKYGRECIALADTDFDFSKKEVTIQAGKNVSDAAEITIKKELEPGTFYCVPVRIAGTDGSMPVLDASSTFYLVLRAPVKSMGVYLGRSNKYIVPSFHDQPKYTNEDGTEVDLSALPELTLECRVMAKNFQKSDPYISSIMGLEGNVCMRFGDVKIGYDVVQVCKGDYQPAAINAPCALNKWYHVAAVWSKSSLKVYIDGKFITETANKGEKVDITEIQLWNGSGIGFGIGAGSNYNSNRPLDGYIAEARVWARALKTAEIANLNDLVIVDPKSEGLVAYWKMNESVAIDEYNQTARWSLRNQMTDLTGHGYHALGQTGDPTFIEATW